MNIKILNQLFKVKHNNKIDSLILINTCKRKKQQQTHFIVSFQNISNHYLI